MKKRAQQLAAMSAKIKQLSREARLQEIGSVLQESSTVSVPSETNSRVSLTKHKPAMSPPKAPTPKQPNEQLAAVMQQNINLQKQLNDLKNQLQSFKIEVDRLTKEKDELNQIRNDIQEELDYRRNVDRKPYFQFSDTLLISISKLPISRNKLHECQFSLMKVSLKEDKVTVKDTEFKKEFILDTITKVVYDRDIIYIQVSPSKAIKDYYLLKFQTEKLMKKWDRALYMNRKLSLCLDRERLFEEEFAEVKRETREYRESVISEKTEEYEASVDEVAVDNADQVQNQHNYVRIQDQDKQSELNVVSQPEILNQPLSVSKLLESHVDPINSDRVLQDQPVQNIAPPNTPPNTLPNTLTLNPYCLPQERLKHTQSVMLDEPPPTIMVSTVARPSNLSVSIPNSNIPKTQSVKMESTKETLLNPIQNIRQSQEDPVNNRLTERTLKSSMDYLKRGYVMTKYAKGGWKPHKKKVFMDENKMDLVWQDLNGKDQKKIPIKDIRSIDQMFGEGMQGREKGLLVEQCVVIGTDYRVLELSCDSREKMEQFLRSLDCVLRGILNLKADSDTKL